MVAPSNGGFAGADRPWTLLRWLLSYGMFAVPQAAGPIAFALLTLPLTGNPRSGAAIVLAITLAQVVGAVPVSRLGRGRNAVGFLRILIAIRTVALAAVAVLAGIGAPLVLLIAVAVLAGLVNGAAFGYLRSVLNHLVTPVQMPRALGLAATLSELTFVGAPVLASVLGTINPVMGVLLLTGLGAVPAVLVPGIPDAMAAASVEKGAGLLTPAILLWLGCAVANSTVVSAIEIGAVSLAVAYGYAPAQGFIFTVALCVASVAGGVWVSARNRAPRPATVLAYLGVMSLGAVLAAANVSVAVTLAGAALVGGVLAPLSTAYSLRLDRLAPPHRRAEVFALSRTATSVGVIVTSTTLTLASLAVTQVIAAVVVCMAAAAVGIALTTGRLVRLR